MYSNVTKDWSTSFSSIVSYKNILNISHMLYQLYYLIISFNLHNSFMKYLLFLLYDTCKIGLAYWSWPKVKGKVSGGTRTKRRPPSCWAHYAWAKYSLPFLVSCLPFAPDLCAWGWPWQPAFPGLLPMYSNGCSQTNEIRREKGGMWMKKVACLISKQSMLCHLATSHYQP